MFFDDLKVTHTKSGVLQYNEYYPFGLQTGGSWTREGSGNDFLYNSANELNRNTGWYETFFRGYDPTLGRFHQVDSLATAANSHTPYNYAFNNPVLFNDPNGDYPPGTLETLGGGGSGGLYSLGISGASGGSYNSIMQGSANHWSDGFTNSDWTWNGGSPSYQAGVAAGMTDIGGTLYHIDGDGSRSALADNNGQYGYYETYVTGTGYHDVTFGKRFVGLEAQQDPPGDTDNWWADLGTAIRLTAGWAFYFGDYETFDNDRVARAMMNSRIVVEARDYWYGKVKSGDKKVTDGLTNFAGEKKIGGENFGFTGLFNAGIDPLEQFIGSTHFFSITSDGKNLTYTITNVTSFESLMYGMTSEFL